MPVDRLVFVQVFRLTCQNTQTHWVLTGSPPTNMFDMFVYFGLQINFLESLGDWSIAGGINAATTVIFLRKHIYAIHTRSYIQHIYLHIYIYTYIHIYIYIFIYSGIYIHIDIPCSHDVFLHLSFTWSKDTPQSQKDAPSSRSAAKPGRQAIVAGGVDLQVAWKLHAKRTLGMIGFGSFLVSNSKGISRVFFFGGGGGDEFLTFSDNHDGQHVYFVLEPEAV